MTNDSGLVNAYVFMFKMHEFIGSSDSSPYLVLQVHPLDYTEMMETLFLCRVEATKNKEYHLVIKTLSNVARITRI